MQRAYYDKNVRGLIHHRQILWNVLTQHYFSETKPEKGREAPVAGRGDPPTHREHLLRGPLSSHVGVMDLLENHPSLVVFAHLVNQGETGENPVLMSADT